jgi:hypothetical protein
MDETAPARKPEINLDTLSLGALEDFEIFEERIAAGEKIKISELNRVLTGLFDSWTLDDTRRLKIGSIPAITDSIRAQIEAQVKK